MFLCERPPTNLFVRPYSLLAEHLSAGVTGVCEAVREAVGLKICSPHLMSLFVGTRLFDVIKCKTNVERNETADHLLRGSFCSGYLEFKYKKK